MGKPSKSGILVCQGATCTCTMAGGATAKLKVITQKKHYINDSNGSEKPIATDKEISVASLNFKTCKPGTNSAHPCTAQLKWKGFYDAVVLENGGSPLLDSSTAKCSTDGGSITILMHGQSGGGVSSGQTAEADENAHSQVNPLVSLGAIKHEIVKPEDLYSVSGS